MILRINWDAPSSSRRLDADIHQREETRRSLNQLIAKGKEIMEREGLQPSSLSAPDIWAAVVAVGRYDQAHRCNGRYLLTDAGEIDRGLSTTERRVAVIAKTIIEAAQEFHRELIRDYNRLPHWAHRRRNDGKDSPLAVLGAARGKQIAGARARDN